MSGDVRSVLEKVPGDILLPISAAACRLGPQAIKRLPLKSVVDRKLWGFSEKGPIPENYVVCLVDSFFCPSLCEVLGAAFTSPLPIPSEFLVPVAVGLARCLRVAREKDSREKGTITAIVIIIGLGCLFNM